MPNDLAKLLHELTHELILTTRILANQKVLDAFGHVSVRHPPRPQALFHAAPSRPELAEAADIIELNLDSEPAQPTETCGRLGLWQNQRHSRCARQASERTLSVLPCRQRNKVNKGG